MKVKLFVIVKKSKKIIIIFKLVYMRRLFLFTILNSATIIYFFNKFVIKGYFNDNEDYMPTLIEEIKDYKYI